MLLVCLLLRPVEPKPAQNRLLDFAPVFRNTQAMGSSSDMARTASSFTE